MSIKNSCLNEHAEVFFTIGYEGRTMREFLSILGLQGIERVIDVRSNPVSRKQGFSKSALKRRLAMCSIEYFHIPEVGIPPALRKNLDSRESYVSLLSAYETDLLPKAGAFADKVGRLARERVSVLLCFERNVQICHRGKLASYLESNAGIEAVHL